MPQEQPFHYNLIDEPWIPVIWKRSREETEVSLRTLFRELHRIESVTGETPIVTGSLYRFLLVLIQSALRDPQSPLPGPQDEEAWFALWEEGGLAEAVLPYLEKYRDHFDLFHPEHPFLQGEPDLTLVKPVSTIDLVPHLAYGATLFDHSLKADDFALTPAEAARWLVAFQHFALGGVVPGKKKTVSAADAPCARAILFIVEGDSLFETLMLNLLRYPDAKLLGFPIEEEDRPFWERDDPFEAREPQGYLDYMTWPSRRVRLYPARTEEGKVIVPRFAVSPGLRVQVVTKQDPLRYHDPMQHYRQKRAKGWVPLAFREDRALWRDSSTILELRRKDEAEPPKALLWLNILSEQQGLPVHTMLRLAALGASTKSGQKLTYFYRHERLPLPTDYLRKPELVETLRLALDQAEKVGAQLWGATRTLATCYLVPESCGGTGGEEKRQPKKEDIDPLLAQWAVERDYWGSLTLPFYEVMEQLPQEGSRAIMERWKAQLRDAARQAFDRIARDLGETPRALKAAITARGQLEGGLVKVLDKPSAEA